MVGAVGRGWSTLSDAADFWMRDIHEAEEAFYLEQERQEEAQARKQAQDPTKVTSAKDLDESGVKVKPSWAVKPVVKVGWTAAKVGHEEGRGVGKAAEILLICAAPASSPPRAHHHETPKSVAVNAVSVLCLPFCLL